MAASRRQLARKINVDGFDVDTVNQMINFMYTHTYYDSTRAGPDDISLLEADSQQEAEPQIQHPQQTESQTVPETEDEISDVMRATALKSLLFHIRMNSIADYYDIPELRHCANTEVQNILSTSWSPRNFPIIIQEVVKSTGDKELRDILSGAMAAHMDELVELGEGIAPPEVISDFAYSVLRRLVVAMHEAKRQARLTIRAHESMKQNIEAFKKLHNATTKCSNYYCSGGFTMEVDPRKDPPSYKLCCRQCKREHTC